MPNLSPFQTLPIHIAEAIACYCIKLQRHRHKDRYAEGNKAKHVWLALHDISRSWMQLARKNLYGSVTVRLSSFPEDDEFITTLHSRRVIEQSTSIMPHVKNVDIRFDDIIEEPNEEDLEKLGQVWPDDLVFPKARSLDCYFGHKYTQASNNARNDNHFRWFMQRVRSSFPNLQEATFRFRQGGVKSISLDVLFSKEWDSSLFLSALFRTAMWEMDDILSPAYMDNGHILVNNAPELTSIHYYNDHNSAFAGRATKKSAKTLEKLYYFGEDCRGFKDFMFDDDGQVIVYPRLKDLRVRASSNDRSKLTTHKSIIPFPVLRHLEVRSNCIFKDDTLFRGSRDTLKGLDIALHRGFVDIFRKHNVFSQGAYPNLFRINVANNGIHGLALTEDEFIEVICGLASPTTQLMMIWGDIPYQHIDGAITTCLYLKNIQVMHITSATLSLLEILNIIKHLPLVTDFGCNLGEIDAELDAIQDKLIPSHLDAQYSQLISRLKCCYIWKSGIFTPDRAIAVLLVTFAVLCPNFTFVKGLKWSKATYESEVGHILSSGLYDQYAERLGNLKLCVGIFIS